MAKPRSITVVHAGEKHSLKFPVVVLITIRVCDVGHASQRDARTAPSINAPFLCALSLISLTDHSLTYTLV